MCTWGQQIELVFGDSFIGFKGTFYTILFVGMYWWKILGMINLFEEVWIDPQDFLSVQGEVVRPCPAPNYLQVVHLFLDRQPRCRDLPKTFESLGMLCLNSRFTHVCTHSILIFNLKSALFNNHHFSTPIIKF